MDDLDMLEQENREYCDAIASHIELLWRIKSLFVVGGIELATTEQVAEFYEAPVSKILMNLTLYEDEFEADSDTAGGWALEHFETYPSGGETFEDNGLKVTILEIDDRRVEKLLVEKM